MGRQDLSGKYHTVMENEILKSLIFLSVSNKSLDQLHSFLMRAECYNIKSIPMFLLRPEFGRSPKISELGPNTRNLDFWDKTNDRRRPENSSSE